MLRSQANQVEDSRVNAVDGEVGPDMNMPAAPGEIIGTTSGEGDSLGARVRVPTERHTEWREDQLERNFRLAVSNWRRCATKLDQLLLESVDVAPLRQLRERLVRYMEDVSMAYDIYQTLPQSVNKESVFSRYDEVERDNHRLVKATAELIRDINDMNGVDARSAASRISKHSSKAGTLSKIESKSSKRSESSSASKRLDAAADAAALKVKLECMELTEQKRLEFERTKTELTRTKSLAELRVAEAKLKALSGEGVVAEHKADLPTENLTTAENVQRYLSSSVNVFPQDVHVVVEPETKEAATSPPDLNIDGAAFRERERSFQPNVYATEFTPRQSGTFFPEVGPVKNETQPNPLFDVINMMSQQVSMGRLPAPEPTIFTGDPLTYPIWRSSFDILIGNTGIPAADKIFYLKRYIGGQAKEAVEGYFLLSNDGAFYEAMDLLQQRYGNPLVIANVFRDKLEAWPQLPYRDGPALRRLADFLRQCTRAMVSIPSLSCLNDEREIRNILSKLPEWLVVRWNRISAEWRERHGLFPPFGEFVKFIVKEADVACDPVSSLQAVKQRSTGKDTKVGRPQFRGANTFVVGTEESKDYKPTCLLGSKTHHLDDCKEFLFKPVQDRKLFAREKGLCYACLNRGHRSKWCKRRKVCNICSGKHPTSLHGDRREDGDDRKAERNYTATSLRVSHLNSAGASSKCAMIVPVMVSQVNNPGSEVKVYALLDTQSDTTFVTEDVCSVLGADGPSVKLRLATMSAKDELIDSRKVNGLVVRGVDNPLCIALPAAYTREIVPANRLHIPTPEVAMRWAHLRGIATELKPLLDIPVALLIGYNCSQALAPREVISAGSGEPFGQRTDLGWGIVGMVDQLALDDDLCDSIGVSHRVLTNEVLAEDCLQVKDNALAGISIVLKTGLKEVVNPGDVSRMLELDFNERASQEIGISQEDQRFVANRVQQIRDQTDPGQWRYVATDDNPADEGSRGISAETLVWSSKWTVGPDFLWSSGGDVLGQNGSEFQLSSEDPEVRSLAVSVSNVVTFGPSFELERLGCISDWFRAKRAIANCLWLKRRLRSVVQDLAIPKTRSRSSKSVCHQRVTVGLLKEAETEIVRLVQSEAFPDEKAALSGKADLVKDAEKDGVLTSGRTLGRLNRLDPFLSEDGLLRVGGRLRHAPLPMSVRHPVILPRQHHITELVIRYFHDKAQHQGRGITTNEVRSNGFWVVGCGSAVAQVIHNCVRCRKMRRPVSEQKMADLPEDRVQPSPPFTFCGMDVFGPWNIREGRKECKRYGVLFTCLVSRAVHINVNALSTDSFINALRRFLAIRGPVQLLRSDRGTNFVGAERELREALGEMDNGRIRAFLLKEHCEYIEFRMNAPSASHMGGVRERQIRTDRSVLVSLLASLGTQLDDESLRTFMCEATAIVNSRPLTVENINDPTCVEPLTPNHLLTMKSKVVLSPPGVFQRADIYCRKRWRRIQYLTDQFWSRWKREYVQSLQVRQKWTQSRRNFCPGDVVLLKDESLSRNHWPLAIVSEVFVDDDTRVRRVRLIVGDSSVDAKGRRTKAQSILERPIQKLVLLVPKTDLS